jgi:cullin 3
VECAWGGRADLARFYRLLARTTAALAQMRQVVGVHTYTHADAATADADVAADPLKWAGALLAQKDAADAALERAWSREKSFQTVANDALRRVVARQPRAAEYLSLFLDDKLRKAGKEVRIVCLTERE